MPEFPNGSAKQVLIVDRCEDNREVLRTALERRGVVTLEASGVDQGLELARQHHPQVIVLDLELAENRDATANRFDTESKKHDGSLVLLGSTTSANATAGHRRVLGKPYHYAPLIRTIEQLISG